MHWFPFYSSDFLGATVGLSCLERGLYALMIPLYYEVGPFPVDPVRTYRIVGCESDEQKRAVDFLLGQFFVLREDGWYQPKAERVKADAAVFHAQAVERGKRSADARREKYGTAQPIDRKRFESVSKAFGNASELTTTTTTTTTKPKEKDSAATASVGSPAEKTAAEASIPACPIDEILTAYHATLPTLPRVLVRNAKREGLIRARWREVFADGKADDKADGIRLFCEYFEHVRGSRFLTGRTDPRPGAAPFVADLEWLMRPTNFAKVIEGRYHRA